MGVGAAEGGGGEGLHIRAWFDGSCSGGKTGIGWWAAVKGPYEADTDESWRPLAAGCRPGQGTDALSAEYEAATRILGLIRAMAKGEEADWADGGEVFGGYGSLA